MNIKTLLLLLITSGLGTIALGALPIGAKPLEMKNVGSAKCKNVQSMTFSGDGSRLILIRKKGLTVLDAKTAKPLRELKLSMTYYSFYSADQRGRYLVAAGFQIVDLLDLSTGKLKRTITKLNKKKYGDLMAVFYATVSTKGNLVATADNRHINVRQLPSGKLIRRGSFVRYAPGLPPLLAFTKTDRSIAAAGIFYTDKREGFEIRVWDTWQDRLLRTIKLHGAEMTSKGMGFSPDGRYFIASHSGGLRIWDVWTGKVRHTVPNLIINAAGFLGNTQRMVVLTADNSLRVWNVKTKMELLKTRLEGVSELAAFSPDGMTMAIAGGTVRIYRFSQ